MKTSTLLAFCVFYVCVFINATSSAPTDDDVDEYDEKLSDFLVEILENFRNQMRDGIPSIGVPPVDPLAIPPVEEDIDDGIAQLVLRMRQTDITGLAGFEIRHLRADLEKGFADFEIAVPELSADGHCYMKGTILGIFPLNSDGPFYIHVKEVVISGRGDLNVTTGEEGTQLRMRDLNLSLTFGSVDVEFKSLLGGNRWTQKLVKLLSGLGGKLFEHFHRPAMEQLNAALLKLINRELEKGTLNSLLDLIPVG